jgi:phosphotransferase system enzyme I (PtsI)
VTLACHGIGVAPGIAMGPAYLLSGRDPLDVAPRSVPPEEIEAEVARFEAAVVQARADLRAVKAHIPPETPTDIAAFIDTHLLMLEDSALITAPRELIREHAYSAEWALRQRRDRLARVFDEMDDPYLRTRRDDVDHVVGQILKHLAGEPGPSGEPPTLAGRIILARDLSPADTIHLKHSGIAGFVTEFGGPMSHTAILARSLGLPAIVGVRQATRCLRHNEPLIIDGDLGVVLADADQRIFEQYRRRLHQSRQRVRNLAALATQPAVSRDGQRITLMANIELQEDIDAAREAGADAVGLYRTEFLYMNRDAVPDEEEHYEAYRRVVEGLGGVPVHIRTLDLGADKDVDGCMAPSTAAGPACNPALGLRAIRLCLREPVLFRPQLRAILRAAALGPVRIMLPMLSSIAEVRQARALIESVKHDLRRERVDFDPHTPVGGMIEVPAAALAAPCFARHLDFLSIGTNDLIQYTLAIDRVDEEVSYLYDPLHPAVLKLIRYTIEAGDEAGIPVSMCGEMAGDPRYVPLLLGMGLRQLSMQPRSLLAAKQVVRASDVAGLERSVERLFQRLDAEDISTLIADFAREFLF